MWIMVADEVADMVVAEVADMEVDKVVDMVADMKVDKVADMVAAMSCFNLVRELVAGVGLLGPNFLRPEAYVPDLRAF